MAIAGGDIKISNLLDSYVLPLGRGLLSKAGDLAAEYVEQKIDRFADALAYDVSLQFNRLLDGGSVLKYEPPSGSGAVQAEDGGWSGCGGSGIRISDPPAYNPADDDTADDDVVDDDTADDDVVDDDTGDDDITDDDVVDDDTGDDDITDDDVVDDDTGDDDIADDDIGDDDAADDDAGDDDAVGHDPLDVPSSELSRRTFSPDPVDNVAYAELCRRGEDGTVEGCTVSQEVVLYSYAPGGTPADSYLDSSEFVFEEAPYDPSTVTPIPLSIVKEDVTVADEEEAGVPFLPAMFDPVDASPIHYFEAWYLGGESGYYGVWQIYRYTSGPGSMVDASSYLYVGLNWDCEEDVEKCYTHYIESTERLYGEDVDLKWVHPCPIGVMWPADLPIPTGCW